MLGVFKKGAIDLTLKAKGLFTSSESSTTYVKDLRKVMVYKERKCQYPKNYDEIVNSGKIIEGKDSDDKIVYKLVYGKQDKDERQPSFNLVSVKEAGDISYFTIDFLVNPKEDKDVKHYDGYYKPFGFSRIDLEKYIPVFEAEKTEDSKYPFELTNSSVLAKKGCSINNKTGEVDEKDRDEKGRNGKLLYTSDYKKLNTSFFEIRDQNRNLELDKSLISVPIVFVTSLAKVFAKCLTYLPMKLGEYLIGKQNPVAKALGYLLFTPTAAVKNLVNMGATVLKAPIFLFVADKKKYGDAYFTMWKYQLKECWKETKNDYSVVKEGERSEPEKKDYTKYEIAGTWDELNAKRQDIEKKLKENNKGTSKETLSRSQSLDFTKTSESQSQNSCSNESISHTNRVVESRGNSQSGRGVAQQPPR